MKTLSPLKRPCGEAAFSRIRHARFLGWENAFDVESEDGLCFLQDHAAIRRANRIPKTAIPVSVSVDAELGSHFIVTYDNGVAAEISWSFIREHPPAQNRQRD